MKKETIERANRITNIVQELENSIKSFNNKMKNQNLDIYLPYKQIFARILEDGNTEFLETLEKIKAKYEKELEEL